MFMMQTVQVTPCINTVFKRNADNVVSFVN